MLESAGVWRLSIVAPGHATTGIQVTLAIPCCATRNNEYTEPMIKTFKHKGLEKFFTKGSKAGIRAVHAAKIGDRLAFLHAASVVGDMDKPGYRLHELKGKLKGHWAVDVSGNWRIVFRFEDGNAYIVNYEDYH
jgi:proteic killer suppression protein